MRNDAGDEGAANDTLTQLIQHGRDREAAELGSEQLGVMGRSTHEPRSDEMGDSTDAVEDRSADASVMTNTTTATAPVDFDAVKARQQATWTVGRLRRHRHHPADRRRERCVRRSTCRPASGS